MRLSRALLFLALGGLLAAAQPAASMPRAARRAAVPAYDPAAILVMRSFTAPAAQPRRVLISKTVQCEKRGAVWSLIDAQHMLAAADSQAALQNWANPGVYTALAVNSPGFAVDRGFTGDAVSSYVDANINLATAANPNCISTFCTFAIWNRSNTTGSSIAGWFDGTDGTTIAPRSASNTIGGRVNNVTQYLTIATTFSDATGWTSVARASSGGGIVIYKNGVSAGSLSGGSVAAAVNSATLTYGHASSAGFVANQFAGGLTGGSMSANLQGNLYACVSGYMTGVGAQ